MFAKTVKCNLVVTLSHTEEGYANDIYTYKFLYKLLLDEPRPRRLSNLISRAF